MAKEKIIVLLLVSIFGAAPLTNDAVAFSTCTCKKDESLEAAFARADSVFIGTVNHVRSELLTQKRRINFTVREQYKGRKHDEISVLAEHARFSSVLEGKTECGIGFDRGADYLVFAFEGSNKSHTLYVSGCSYTSPLEKAPDDVMRTVEQLALEIAEAKKKERGYRRHLEN